MEHEALMPEIYSTENLHNIPESKHNVSHRQIWRYNEEMSSDHLETVLEVHRRVSVGMGTSDLRFEGGIGIFRSSERCGT